MPTGPAGEFGRFPTTHWSLVARAGGTDDARLAALDDLLVRYLPALRAHLVYGRRIAAHDAEDVLQEFVAAKILHRHLLRHADQQLGHFRSFLLKSLDRFLIDQLRKQQAMRRAPAGGVMVSLGDDDAQLPAAETASDAFDAAWARSVLDETLARMQEHCRQSNRDDCWGVFAGRVLDPILHGTAPIGYDEMVQRFGLQSPTQASNVLMTAKRMFTRALRSVVGQYATEDEVDVEIAHLQKVLSQMRV